MAKYVFLFVGSDEAMESQPQEQLQRAYAEIGKWWEEHSRQGIIKGGEELAPGHTATTIRKRDAKVVVTDGPFMETKERVGGFAIVELPDLDAAISLAKTWPAGDVEVRPVVEH